MNPYAGAKASKTFVSAIPPRPQKKRDCVYYTTGGEEKSMRAAKSYESANLLHGRTHSRQTAMPRTAVTGQEPITACQPA